MTLSFTLANHGAAIQIDCDNEGLDALIAALQKARGAGHVHLCSPGNGGRLLDATDPWGNPAIGEVIVTLGGD